MADISPELVERMVNVIRWLADANQGHADAIRMWGLTGTDEAKAIAALLPVPVDPDLIEARSLVAQQYESLWPPVLHLAAQAMSGDGDDWFQMKCTLAAIKRGRELAALTHEMEEVA